MGVSRPTIYSIENDRSDGLFRVGRHRGSDRRLLVRIANGHSGQPYDWLLAIAGLAYLLAVVLLRWRG